jgi:non-ribosomal peptide synthetase component E (peptide arylation enzyme)
LKTHERKQASSTDEIAGVRYCVPGIPQDIAKFKLPECLELVEQFPLSPFGRVSTKDLTEMIAAKLAEEERG